MQKKSRKFVYLIFINTYVRYYKPRRKFCIVLTQIKGHDGICAVCTLPSSYAICIHIVYYNSMGCIRCISLNLTEPKQIYALKVCINSKIRYIYRVWRGISHHFLSRMREALLHTHDTDYKSLHTPVTMSF